MSHSGRVHVVGAGLAGLAAALALSRAGREVCLYEAGAQAGGRCRSYFDSELGCRLDNGNHLLLAGNRGAITYLDRIGARDTVHGPGEAAFPFIDLESGLRWTLRLNDGRLPWWMLRASCRVPHSRATDYLRVLRLRLAGPEASVAAILDPEGRLFRRLWEPLAVAALNTQGSVGSARLFWRILAETVLRGGAACHPLVPRHGLSESLVDPALAVLRREGAVIRLRTRLRGLALAANRVAGMSFDDSTIELSAADRIVLAVPPADAARLLPGLVVPDAFAPIVNAHFRIEAPHTSPLFIGIVGGTAEWVFRKEGVLSVTVSAADRLVDLPAERLRERLWQDVAIAYRLPPASVPPARIVKERRATFLASPAQCRRRPSAVTRWENLFLAGDFVETGLPATIEGAIRSGLAAAQLAHGHAGGNRDQRTSITPLSITPLSGGGFTAIFAAGTNKTRHIVLHE
jgi:squalene-associated FAD-dependent desaturase